MKNKKKKKQKKKKICFELAESTNHVLRLTHRGLSSFFPFYLFLSFLLIGPTETTCCLCLCGGTTRHFYSERDGKARISQRGETCGGPLRGGFYTKSLPDGKIYSLHVVIKMGNLHVGIRSFHFFCLSKIEIFVCLICGARQRARGGSREREKREKREREEPPHRARNEKGKKN